MELERSGERKGGWEAVGRGNFSCSSVYRDEAQVEIVNPRAESHVFHLPSTLKSR